MPWPTKKQTQAVALVSVETSFPTGREIKETTIYAEDLGTCGSQQMIEYDNYGRVIKIDNVPVPIRQEHAINPMPPEIVILPTDNLNKATSGAPPKPPKRKYKPRKKVTTKEVIKKRHQWRWGIPETSQKVERYISTGGFEVYAFDIKSAAKMIAGQIAKHIFGPVCYYRQCRVTPRQPKDKTLAQFRVLLGAGLGAKIKGVQREYEISVVFRIRHISDTEPKIPLHLLKR